MTKVITYQSPRGETINITPAQERQFRKAQVWPRDPVDGQEYCSVSHGLHVGEPTFSDDQIVAIIAAA